MKTLIKFILIVALVSFLIGYAETYIMTRSIPAEMEQQHERTVESGLLEQNQAGTDGEPDGSPLPEDTKRVAKTNRSHRHIMERANKE